MGLRRVHIINIIKAEVHSPKKVKGRFGSRSRRESPRRAQMTKKEGMPDLLWLASLT
jgi:hypothetical protein